ncbi:hypothetical protein [Botrimarina hoheduenensis]|uniref:Uncharacterized protein n=1 Tax=Botrimarina hoheduenensis TaxID=2528000 RepID=A0A5C5W9J5_9BACT|nr:hypothetical protein [Botrimarina hoheduenensis]TWT46865.1 hypothetical protein Pla111_19670 [Botrimarina hoheduenensis]
MAKVESSLQTFYRLTIMAGTLAVGSLAAYRYGPPADQLADHIDQAMALVQQRWEASAPTPMSSTSTANALPIASAGPNMNAGEAPLYDDQLQTVGFDTASAPPASAELPEMRVAPWGNEGLHRASMTVPSALGNRHLDAIGATRDEAISNLTAQAQSLR